MHQNEWEKLTVDEKLEHLRMEGVVQQALILSLMRALNATVDGELVEAEETDELATT